MRFLLAILLGFACNYLDAQPFCKVNTSAGEILPDWAIAMYGDNPNVWAVDDAYRMWRRANPDLKTTYTQYYKKWRRAINPFIAETGYVAYPSAAEERAFRELQSSLVQEKQNSGRHHAADWQVIGPFETFNTNTGPSPLAKSEQANIYCFDQSLSHPDVLYACTEGAEIFKSSDKGLNWSCVSRRYAMSVAGAIEVHPSDPDIVFVGEGNRIRRSLDGGNAWDVVLEAGDLWTNDIKVNPANPLLVLAATQIGLYRSEDGGTSWYRILDKACYDLEWKTNDPASVFLVCNDPIQQICRFYKSTDFGLNWEQKDNGWFFSAEEGRADGGARLAVTDADPNRVYAVLIGEARTGDAGFIGIWRSNDAGESWTQTNPPAGGPWNDTDHPNLATIGRTGGYHQGFYNLGFDASDSNPDHLLAGFLNLWRSTDGAKSFECIGGYCNNSFNYVHPDCQEIEINGNDVWMTSDGGIEYSNDFFATHYALNRGITSSDFWGFGAGWNEDILVGGRYHNGNMGWYENWMPGEVLGLGGGEAPTGYVNPGPGRLTYYSDIGGVALPELQNGFARYFGIGKYPNESYYDAESGEIEWDPRYWTTFFVSRENTLWKTEDGGATFDTLYVFGTDPNARAMQFEISRSDPKVMYLFQRNAASWEQGNLWKSTDGGEAWSALSLPPGYARRALLAMSAEAADRLWIAYADGGNGQKIFTSRDGGATWENLTTPTLNGEHITYILHQGGTDGGLYLGTFRTIWYRDDSMDDWTPYSEGLPEQISTCLLRPFYRDNKLRLGAYGKGIWESPLAVPSRPIAQPMAEKRITSCPGDQIRFDDYSILAHEGATWAWTFPGGTPSSSSARNPVVTYTHPGTYDVILTVANPNGTSTKTMPAMIEVQDPIIHDVPPPIDFSTTADFTIVNPDEGLTWAPVEINTCDPEGTTAYFVDNYIYSSYGIDDILLPENIDLTNAAAATLRFDVAYAPYYDGNFFIDSLHVIVSADCGKTEDIVFRSGGAALSTTTSGIGPDNLYEYDPFRPQSCEEWRTVEIDLSAYAGKYVTIRFRNRSGYGNNMYLDNIALETPSTSATNPNDRVMFSIYPNPTTGTSLVSGRTDGNAVVSVLNAEGVTLERREIAGGGPWSASLNISRYAPGVYFIKVSDYLGHTRTEKVVKL